MRVFSVFSLSIMYFSPPDQMFLLSSFSTLSLTSMKPGWPSASSSVSTVAASPATLTNQNQSSASLSPPITAHLTHSSRIWQSTDLRT